MSSPAAISVVIPALNAAETIGRQLAALASQQWNGEWEVVVADNGSSDETAARVAAWIDQLPALCIVDASSTRGPGHARNVGARAATGAFLLFVDADDVVQPGWLAHMAAAATEHPLIAGALRETSDRGFDPGTGLGRTTRWSTMLPSQGFLDAAASGNLGARKELWMAVGGFRESMVASEDTAFCWDAQLLGYEIHRVPDAIVAYSMRSSLRHLWHQQFRWGMAAAQLYALYRFDGAPRSSARGAVLRWIGLLVTAPFILFSANERRDWVGRVARRTGRVAGSLRFRVLCL